MNKSIRTILCFALLCFAVVLLYFGRGLWNRPNMTTNADDFKLEVYNNSDNLLYLSEDYMVDDQIVLKQGYYETVNLKGTSQSIFIPIDPKSLERLPSDDFEEGTTFEIDGKKYIIHVTGSEYSAELEENK